VHDLSPWIDLRVPPKDVKLPALEAQTNRRFVKTHLPVDALVYSPKAKYLYIARDGRDVVWSLYNHHANGNDLWYALLNDTPGRVGPPLEKPNPDIHAYFLEWLEKDGHPFWPFWENVRTWWEIRDLPNIKLVHFNDLRADLPGEMQAIADFLGITLTPEQMADAVKHSTFDYMKANADKSAPLGGAIFEGGGATFINKGTNGRWKDVLTADDCARYEARAVAELGEACAAWLAHGRAPA
jgi:aryl sulfotransferase